MREGATEAEAFLESRGLAIAQMRGWPHLHRTLEDAGPRPWESLLHHHQTREAYIARFGFAVLTAPIVRALAPYAPLLEVGAGSGYWTYELKKAGIDSIATDPGTGRYRNVGTSGHWEEFWTPVERLTGPEAVAKYPTRTLLTVWPDLAEWGAQTLLAFEGKLVLYGGEGPGGCTADDRFHALLEERFEQSEVIELPQFDGLHDELILYRRR
jgi:hypothetical protein